MTTEEMRQDIINMVPMLSDEQCKSLIRVFSLLKTLIDEQVEKAVQLIKDGMSLDELAALLENGGMPV